MTNDSVATSTVAAFLRVVYASLKFSPNPSLTKISLNQVTEQEIFRRITMLCYKAGWTTGNIGLKYLKIIRIIIEKDELLEEPTETNSGDLSKKKKKSKVNMTLRAVRERLYFYEIVSRAIKQILN